MIWHLLYMMQDACRPPIVSVMPRLYLYLLLPSTVNGKSLLGNLEVDASVLAGGERYTKFKQLADDV